MKTYMCVQIWIYGPPVDVIEGLRQRFGRPVDHVVEQGLVVGHSVIEREVVCRIHRVQVHRYGYGLGWGCLGGGGGSSGNGSGGSGGRRQR